MQYLRQAKGPTAMTKSHVKPVRHDVLAAATQSEGAEHWAAQKSGSWSATWTQVRLSHSSAGEAMTVTDPPSTPTEQDRPDVVASPPEALLSTVGSLSTPDPPPSSSPHPDEARSPARVSVTNTLRRLIGATAITV